jgi:ATP-dependent RNA helicase DeaD
MTDFEGVAPVFAGALTAHGYTALTPVQEEVLAAEPGADLLVSAQTGSGKTVAFGLAMAPTLLGAEERFGAPGDPLALVVAPTRELALQVRRELEWLNEPARARIVSCVGGMEMRQERRALADGAHIVVGTPGRICDHIRRGSLDMNSIRVVVLDEADEMLDLGFREDLEFILGAAPAERRTLMFSATIPAPILSLAKRFQRNAVRISTTGESKQHADIEYRAMPVSEKEREHAVINVLRYFEANSAIVFCATRIGVTHLSSRLGNRGFSVVALSGELSQSERTHALQAMRDGRARVCVATDVAARGLDLPNLDLVIHADLPRNGEALLHRSGRTGRAGRKGVSAILVPHAKRRGMERLLRMADIRANWSPPPTAAAILRQDRERLMSDPVLAAEITEEERSFAAELLARHTPEEIAAAYLRQNQAARPAPEEFVETAPAPDDPKPARSDFAGGQWFKLSVGRKQNAEPRWLLPLICRAGGITKRHVGAIRIYENESRFEVAPNVLQDFIASVARAGGGEKSVTITRTDGPQDDAGGRPTMRRGGTGPGFPRADAPQGDASSRAKSWRAGKAAGGGKPFTKRPPRPANESPFAKPAHGKRKERT